MSFLDKITSALGSGSDKQAAYQAILEWFEQQGGVSTLLDKFRDKGLGAVVDSWLSGEKNIQLTADQIQSVFGESSIKDLASKVGGDSAKATSLLAEYLPLLVDKLSPAGELAKEEGMLEKALHLLKGKLTGGN